tara:strand:+ start:1033 stop:1689 length:657 start_codon:yes stop_codon:yes gene_type:complete
MKNLAVIPARGGSTRLKGKNIYPLGGKPLIRWITEAVVDSGCFDTILISTDDDRIFDSVSDLGVGRHIRPEQHATTQATVLDAMMNLMGLFDGFDTFSYFLPTCPFVDPEDIRSGINLLRDADFAISMTQIPETIQLACVMNGDSVLPIFDNLECGLTNSKFIKKYYKPSGAFYMGWWNTLRKTQNFFKGNVKGVLIPHERSIDINTIEDIKYAESLL